MNILGIPGSLRKGSFNRKLLGVAASLLPAGATLEVFELADIPVYNQDLDDDMPARVLEFKKAIKAADAILICTPEYNYSIPGPLKNAIDWASRPYGESAWTGKPVAVMGASTGAFGTARSQLHLRQVFVTLGMKAVAQPEVLIANAKEKFDEDGSLKDEDARKLVRALLEKLAVRA